MREARMEIIRLRVNLKHVEPKVMRSLLVPLDIQLQDLHITLQVAVGWRNSHLYSFETPETIWQGYNNDFGFDFRENYSVNGVSLRKFLTRTGVKRFLYLYDFGDYWEHVIHTGAVTEAKAGELYPQLTNVKGRCPPEDVGGPWGYEEFLHIMSDVNHPEHEEMADWYLGSFDVNDLREEILHRNVKDVAKLMTEGKAAKEHFGYDPTDFF